MDSLETFDTNRPSSCGCHEPTRICITHGAARMAGAARHPSALNEIDDRTVGSSDAVNRRPFGTRVSLNSAVLSSQCEHNRVGCPCVRERPGLPASTA